MELFDAVITGAGPAGSTLARTLAGKGFRVLLVEKETPGSRRVCGGFAGPEINDFFSSAGLSSGFAALPKNEIRHVRISGARSGTLDTTWVGGTGWAVDRSIFDAWLAREAVSLGVELATHSTLASAFRSAGIWNMLVNKNNTFRNIRTRFYFVATGRRTPKPSAGKSIYFACKTTYENSSTPSDRVSLHFVEKGHVGLNPLGDGKTALCLYVESSYLRACKGDLDEMMRRLMRVNPGLGKDLLGAKRAADWQTCAAEPDHKKLFYHEGIFFTGDALTMVNPIVGGGMSIATASAQLLGELVADGRAQRWTDKKIASAYEKAWTGRFKKRVDLASSLGRVERSTFLSETLFFLMGTMPAVFSGLVHRTRRDTALSSLQDSSAA